MPLREKAKSLFKTKSKTSDRDSSLSKTSTISTTSSSRERWPSNVYKPNEPMPRPKYRAIPKKEHTELLQAFSFPDAWRKTSFQSQHSPMGTRLHSRANSRRNSAVNTGRRSMSSAGRSSSVTSIDAANYSVKKTKAAKDPSTPFAAAKPTPLSTEPEEAGDGDIRNVGISRVNSAQPPATMDFARLSTERSRVSTERLRPVIGFRGQSNSYFRPLSTAHDHQPFSEQDLASALTRAHLAVPAN